MGGTTTQYVYGLNGLLTGEYTSAGVLIREYVYLNDQPLAQVDAGSPEVLTYLHADHLGTPKYGTNTGGTQVWAANTDAFGVGTPTGSRTVNLRMAGQYYDAESGLFYNWNRYYNPNIGRYISSDPIGQEGGLNLFSYVGQSPIMFKDMNGLEMVPWDDEIGTEGATQLPLGGGGGGSIQIAPSKPLTEVFNGYSRPGLPTAGSMCEPVQNSPVKGFTKHGVQRAIGDTRMRAGTRPEAILDALKNPSKITSGIDKSGRPYKVFYGQNARVVINPETGEVISVNPLSGAGAQ